MWALSLRLVSGLVAVAPAFGDPEQGEAGVTDSLAAQGARAVVQYRDMIDA